MKAKLIKTKTGFYLWRNPLDKSQELLGATVPIMNDNGVDLREYILSLKNCQEIEFGYDLDELVLEFIGEDDGHSSTTDNSYCFKKGFKKAIEILGDKKFDELDITSAMNRVWNWCEMQEDEECSSMTELRDKHLKSLQQTEWDVEIEMVKEEYIWSPPGEGFEDQTYRGCREVPKLDADGCLILKLKL